MPRYRVSHCGMEGCVGHKNCRACHRLYMQRWRAMNPEPESSRVRRNARAYANSYLRRGKIARGPCVKCGAPGEQMHHRDYGKPLEIEWMCRRCHLAEHGMVAGRYREPSVDSGGNSGTV